MFLLYFNIYPFSFFFVYYFYLIREIRAGAFSQISKFTELGLVYNKICWLKSTAFSGLSNVQKLWLYGNKLENKLVSLTAEVYIKQVSGFEHLVSSVGVHVIP